MWLHVTKRFDGTRKYRIRPRPTRDLAPRHRAAEILARADRSPSLAELDERESGFSLSAVNELAGKLETEDEDLSDAVVSQITAVANMLGRWHDSSPKYVQQLVSRLEQLALAEGEPNPQDQAVASLRARLPTFIAFEDDYRGLEQEYAVAELPRLSDTAIGNLLRLAGLDARQLVEAVDASDIGDVDTKLRRANQALSRAFETWSQEDVTPQLNVDSGRLHVLVVERASERSTALDYRSDGLRQFIALRGFLETQPPTTSSILLIDEAELHLHYDGQADLVQLLAGAGASSVAKAIYTTHSIGSLPENVGGDVRLVKHIRGSGRSELVNWFWREDAPGLMPLLIGMGAATVAYFPVRDAVLAEGPTDFLLLPLLFREATDSRTVGFQVVPGLADIKYDQIKVLESAGSRVVYLYDNDDAGRKHARRLQDRAEVEKDRVFFLAKRSSPVRTPEDLLRKPVLLNAFDRWLARWHPTVEARPSSRDLPAGGRASMLGAWCKDRQIEFEKRPFACEVLDIAQKEPALRVLADRRAGIVRRLHEAIARQLERSSKGEV